MKKLMTGLTILMIGLTATSCQMPQGVDAYTQQITQTLMLKESRQLDEMINHRAFFQWHGNHPSLWLVNENDDLETLKLAIQDVKHLGTIIRLNRQMLQFEVKLLKDYALVINQADLILSEDLKSLLISSKLIVTELRQNFKVSLQSLKDQGQLVRQSWQTRVVGIDDQNWLIHFVDLIQDYVTLQIDLNTILSSLIDQVFIVQESITSLLIEENLKSEAFLASVAAIRLNFASINTITQDIHAYQKDAMTLRQAILMEVKRREENEATPLTEEVMVILMAIKVELEGLRDTHKDLLETRFNLIQLLIESNQSPELLSIDQPILLLQENLVVTATIWVNRISLLQQTFNLLTVE